MTNLNSVWQLIANTPWWVYALFILLFRTAWLSTKPRIIPLRNFIIFPSLFISLSLFILLLTQQTTLFNLSLWSISMMGGSFLGWLQYRVLRIKAIQNEAKLYFSGSWSMFLFMLALFIAQFYYSDIFNLDPQWLLAPSFSKWLFILYGLLTGLCVGKLIYSLRCVKIGPFTT